MLQQVSDFFWYCCYENARIMMTFLFIFNLQGFIVTELTDQLWF